MQLALRFWGRLAIWSGVLFVVLVVVSLTSGQPVTEVLAHLPSWAGLALAPLIGRRLGPDAGAATALEPARLSLSELRTAAREAMARAEATTGTEAVRQWQAANRFVWHLARRTDGTTLPFFFGLIGVPTGFWSRCAPRAEMQQLQQWAWGFS